MLVLYAGSCSDTDLSTGTSPGPPLELLQVTIYVRPFQLHILKSGPDPYVIPHSDMYY
jgi:hypothetical protein